MVPGISIEEIDRHQTVASFNLSYQLPFRAYVGAERLFRQYMLVVRQSLPNVLRPRIRKRKQSHGIDRRVAKDGIGVVTDCCVRYLLSGQSARLTADVVHCGYIPKIVLLPSGHKSTPHPAVTEDSYPKFLRHTVARLCLLRPLPFNVQPQTEHPPLHM